jgi:ferrous iron transport protein B
MPVIDSLQNTLPLRRDVAVRLAAGIYRTRDYNNAPAWVSGLIVDGLIGGAGTVLTFIPVLILFFLILGILEDIGYLARAAYIMDRFMHTMGLHGRSFLPLFLGFGCNVPAVTGTRIIDESRSRLLTILLVPFIPCTARLAVIAFIAPAFFGDKSALITWLLVAGNLLILMLVGVTINRFVLKGKRTPFIMEMPLYHIPNVRTIGIYVWQNTFAFIKKAGGIIVIFAAIIWALSWFPTGDINTSLLANFGRWMEPFGRLMGFKDWRLLVSLFTSFIAKENTIASLGVLYGMNKTGLSLRETLSQSMTPAAGFAFMVVQMLFVPCIATMAVIKQETASWKWTLFSVTLLLLISLSAGIGVYQLARLLNLGM